ncbi:MAG: hypothetical protein WD021_02725 [Rhodothermales bacterium]
MTDRRGGKRVIVNAAIVQLRPVTRQKKSLRVLLGTLLVYAFLVATNLGEFWPFSIYPMFSQGGIPWSRAVVREVPDDSVRWESTRLEHLPGDPYPLAQHGIDHIDLANFVSKTEIWDDDRLAALRKMFGEDELDRRHLLVLRARGRISASDLVILSFEPYVLLTHDETMSSDHLPR